MTRALLFLAGLLACLTTQCGPARADTVQRTLQALCGARGEAIADLVRVEARRNLLRPTLLAAVIAAESRCNPRADSHRGDRGLMQLRVGGSAARGVDPDELRNPAVNVRLGARHLAWCLRLCGSVAGGLSVFSGRRRCKPSPYSARVLGLLLEAMKLASPAT